MEKWLSQVSILGIVVFFIVLSVGSGNVQFCLRVAEKLYFICPSIELSLVLPKEHLQLFSQNQQPYYFSCRKSINFRFYFYNCKPRVANTYRKSYF